MTDLLTTTLLAAGTVATSGWAVFGYAVPMGERRGWERSFDQHKDALAELVLVDVDSQQGSSTDSSDVQKSVDAQVEALRVFHKPLKKHEAETFKQNSHYSIFADKRPAIYGMRLTHVYARQQTSYFADEAVYLRLNPASDDNDHPRGCTRYLDGYIKKLKTVNEWASSPYLVDSKWFQRAIRVWLKEHASHLLLNYRTSPTQKLEADAVEKKKAVNRQAKLDSEYSRLSADADRMIRRGIDNQVLDAPGMVDEAKQIALKVKGELVAENAQVEIAEPLVLPALPGASEREKSLVEEYFTNANSLPETARVEGERLITKLGAALASLEKAKEFSPAAQAHATYLATANRDLAVSELSEILEPVRSKEEQEFIHALRVDNKYLQARKQDNEAQKQEREAEVANA